MKKDEKGMKNNTNNEPLKSLLKSMDDFFNAKPLRGAMDSIDGFFQLSFLASFPVDLYETSDHLVITAKIPGLKREQIFLEVEGNTLKISVEHLEVNNVENDTKRYYKRERAYQISERYVQLPYPISEKDVSATYQNGILKVCTPRGIRRKSRIQIEE